MRALASGWLVCVSIAGVIVLAKVLRRLWLDHQAGNYLATAWLVAFSLVLCLALTAWALVTVSR